jgi:hypothetical protein
VRVRGDDEVAAPARRPQIGDGCAPPPPLADGCLIIPDAVLGCAVEIGIAGDSGLDGTLDDGVYDLVLVMGVGDFQRTADAMELILAPILVLSLAEKGQHALIVPTDAAELAPTVVVGGSAAHVDHAIQRTGAAEHLATRLVRRAAVETGDGLALEFPIVGIVREELVIADGNVDPRVVVAPASLEQQHSIAARLRQSRGDRASGRSSARYNEIVSVLVHAATRCDCRLSRCYRSVRPSRAV